MSANSRFAAAIHVLALLALDNRPLTSQDIADSVNTNAVVIRRILGRLRQAGLVRTRRGVGGGTRLARHPAEITLLDVYQVVEHSDLLARHPSSPNSCCACAQGLQPVLTGVFRRMETAIEDVLTATTLAQVVGQITAQAGSGAKWTHSRSTLS